MKTPIRALSILATAVLFFLSASLEAKINYEKIAKKEAKKLTKQGWVVNAGVQPIQLQMAKSYQMEDELDAKGDDKKYIFGTALALGGNYRAAKLSATHAAKVEIAGLLGERIAALTEEMVANKELTPSEAESVSKITAASKGMIAEQLRKTNIIVETYRYKGPKEAPEGVEVQVRVAYNKGEADKIAKETIVKELEKEASDTAAKLDKMMGLAE